MAVEKKVNFTEAQTIDLVGTYQAAANQEEREQIVHHFAESFEKKERSIIMKLVREGVYIKPERIAKDGKPVMKKETLVDHIADLAGVSADTFDSLEKANKRVLAILADTLASFRSE